MKRDIPEKGTLLYMVGENCNYKEIPLMIFAEQVKGPYQWKDSRGFKTVTVPDYKKQIFPTSYYWRMRDLGTRIFETREEAEAELERMEREELEKQMAALEGYARTRKNSIKLAKTR